MTDKAECAKKAVPDDTVRGGLMTFFIEGNPAARILDKTDVGNIVTGSPDIELGEWAGGALTMEQAQWLYDYMALEFRYRKHGWEPRTTLLICSYPSTIMRTEPQVSIGGTM